jgi:hypothetical protein
VPVTAKFSKAFYDKFGHSVVDELVNWVNQVDATYRTELRELNESNFARFDAKLEQRIAELRADFRTELRTELGGIRADLQTGLARLEGGLLARIGMAEGRLARLTLTLWAVTLGTLVALLKL